MEEELQLTNRDLERFAYVASHDLQEPLRTIMLASEIYRVQRTGGPADSDDAAEFVNTVQKTASGMKGMIADLLSYSRAGSSVNLRVQKINSSEALSAAIENLNGSVEDSKAEITIAGVLPDVMADPMRLAQVFQNLIGNSIKYRRPDVKPVIRIATEQKGSHWLFSVQDNGIGFDPNHAHRLFGIFQRLHDTNVSGTGIGLATCKMIIEQAGGKIWAESEPGEGATFYFTSPVAAAAA